MPDSQQLRTVLDAGDLDGLARLLREDPAMVRRTHAWGEPCAIGPCQPISYLAQARFNGFVMHDRSGAMTRVLLQAGAPVEGDPADPETPLITAASYHEAAVARALVEAGASLEATGYAVTNGTALAHAVAFGAVEIVDLLVAAGSPIRSLREAAGTGHLGRMLEACGDPAEKALALRAAAVCERLAVIDALVAAGVPVNQLVNGGTALHWAAWEAKVLAARHLASLGADVTLRDPAYQGTPLDWARHRSAECLNAHPGGHFEVIRFLEAHLSPKPVS